MPCGIPGPVALNLRFSAASGPFQRWLPGSGRDRRTDHFRKGL